MIQILKNFGIIKKSKIEALHVRTCCMLQQNRNKDQKGRQRFPSKIYSWIRVSNQNMFQSKVKIAKNSRKIWKKKWKQTV
jgi:hypothetical protein